MSAKLRGPLWFSMDCSCGLLMTAGTDGASEPTDTLADVLDREEGAR